METFNDEQKDKDIEFYSHFRSLWKTENPDWLAKRQASWLTVNGEADDPHTMFLEKYYVYGEEPPGYIGPWGSWDHPVAFKFYNRVAFMPFQTAEEVAEFWKTVLKRYTTGFEHMHADFRYIGDTLNGFPERDEMVKLITETVFSADYFMVPSDSKFVNEGTLATINPRDFVIGYSDVSPFYHENNKNKWDYQSFSFDYFILSVRECEESNRLVTPRSKKRLPSMYEYLLKLDDSNLSEYRAELKQRLMAAAEDQNSPALLKDALAEARNG